MAEALGMTDAALVGLAQEGGARGIAERPAPYAAATVVPEAGDAALGRAVRALLFVHDTPSPPLQPIAWLDGAGAGHYPPLALPRWLLPDGVDPAALRVADDGFRARGVARGDIAIVDRARPEALDDRLVVVRVDGVPVLGICRLADGMALLTRPGYPDLPLHADSAMIIGRFAALIAIGPR